MAKTPKHSQTDSKNTIPLNDDDVTVVLNTSISKGLLKRIRAFQKSSGMSSEQEAIRVGMNLFLAKNGF